MLSEPQAFEPYLGAEVCHHLFVVWFFILLLLIKFLLQASVSSKFPATESIWKSKYHLMVLAELMELQASFLSKLAKRPGQTVACVSALRSQWQPCRMFFPLPINEQGASCQRKWDLETCSLTQHNIARAEKECFSWKKRVSVTLAWDLVN